MKLRTHGEDQHSGGGSENCDRKAKLGIVPEADFDMAARGFDHDDVGHGAEDGARGQGEQAGEERQTTADDDGHHQRREHETYRAVDEQRGEHTGGQGHVEQQARRGVLAVRSTQSGVLPVPAYSSPRQVSA